ERFAPCSDGTTVLVVVAVAIVLGLRHASDPDHLAAVTTLIASGQERAARGAARLGLVWGLGHGTSLFAFGVPIVLYRTYLPATVQSGAETAVGAIVVALAVWLLVRWRRGVFAIHEHEPEHGSHVHAGRTPFQAYLIGLVHGTGGSAGIGVLLLASIPGRQLALGSLALVAARPAPPTA